MSESQKFTPEEEIDQALVNIDASLGDLEQVGHKTTIPDRLRDFTTIRDRNKQTKTIIRNLKGRPEIGKK